MTDKIEGWLDSAPDAGRLRVAADMEGTPDSAAQAVRLGSELNLSAETIKRDPKMWDTRSKELDAHAYTRKSPKVSAWLGQVPENYQAASDDLENASAHEQLFEDYSFMKSMGSSLMSGLNQVNTSIARLPGAVYEAAALPQNLAFKYLGRPDLQVGAPELLRADRVAKFYEGQVQAYKNQSPDLEGSPWDLLINQGDFARGGRALAAQVVSNSPNMAFIIASTLGGMPGAGLVTAGALAGSQASEQARESGVDPTARGLHSLMSGVAEAGMENLSFGTVGLLKKQVSEVAKKYGKQTAVEFLKATGATLAESFAGEASEEALTELVQAGSEYLNGVDPKALDNLFERMMDAALVGGASGAAMSGPAAIAAGANQAQAARDAKKTKDFYLALGSTAEESKLRERLPQGHQQLVAHLTADGPVENVYIPIEAVEEHFQSLGESPTALAVKYGFGEAYEEAKLTGGDLRVPLSNWVEKVVGTDTYKALADDVKFSPEDLTVNQVKELKESTAAEAAANAPAEEESEVSIAMRNQLGEAGFDAETADAYAKMVDAGFKNLGERSGQDLGKKYQLGVKRTQDNSLMGKVRGRILKSLGLAPPEVKFEPMPGLKPEQKMAEQKLGEIVSSHKAWEDYKKMPGTMGGKLLDADMARELLPEYAADQTGRTLHTASTQRPSTAFITHHFRERLAKKPTGPVLMLAGGGGSGKSTVTAKYLPGAMANADIVLDGVLANYNKANQYIEQSLASGRTVDLTFVYRPVESAAEGAAQRFERTGRYVPADVLTADHVKALDTFLKLEEKYKDDPDVTFQVFDNSGQEPVPISIDKLNGYEYSKPGESAEETVDRLLPKVKEVMQDVERRVETTHAENFQAPYQRRDEGEVRGQSGVDGGGGNTSVDRSGAERPAGGGERGQDRQAALAQPLPGYSGGPGSSAEVRQAALDYALEAGLPVRQPSEYVQVDPERGARIAQAFEEMKHAPGDPEVAASYRALIDETMAQYQTIKSLGYTFNRIDGENPYPEGPKQAVEDVRKNKHLWFFPTTDGFGSINQITDNPLLEMTGEFIDGRELMANDVFRIVHDIFGHVKEGATFGPRGEENAWQSHMRMYSDLAAKAMTSETRGQNSRVNYGPYGEKNRLNPMDTTYADQKIGLLPDWVMTDGLAPDAETVREQPDRGKIRYSGKRKFSIELLADADLSTFLHEMGHFYLDVLTDISGPKGAPADLKKDLAIVREWVGNHGEKFTDEQHEQFARGFETYLMEGKAPSTELRPVFHKFRAWLLSIYQRLQKLNAPLSEPVRGVFDRILASREQIEAVSKEQAFDMLDPALLLKAGVPKNEVDRYVDAVSDAKEFSHRALEARALDDVNREKKAWWKSERSKVQAEVEELVNTQPEYIALRTLQEGEEFIRYNKENGVEIPESFGRLKLNKKSILDVYGEEALKGLPKPYVYSVEGGITPDEAAVLFGFKDGWYLLKAISDATPRKELIQDLTDAQMKELHGDLTLENKLPEAALKALHTDKHLEVLRMEAGFLAKNNMGAVKGMAKAILKKVPRADYLTAQAQGAIASKKVRDVQPQVYQRAEAKAGHRAVDLALKGDWGGAFRAKYQQILNHELYRAALEAKETVDATVTYMRRFDDSAVRQRIAKAGEGYLDQIDDLAERFDFRRAVSLKAIDRRKSLLAWVLEQKQAGNEAVVVPEKLLDDAYRVRYKDATVEVLTGVRDSVKMIERLANLKGRLLANQEHREFEAAKAELLASAEANHDISPEPVDFAPGLASQIKKGMKNFMAWHTRMEFLFEYLDGFKAGGSFWRIIFKPFATAESKENQLMNEASQALKDIFSVYPKAERASWFMSKVNIPEIDASLSKANILAVALNLGNDYNREALKEGYKWSDEQVDAIVKHLTKKDIDTVNSIHRYIDSYWPEIKATEERLNGLAPEKVESSPYETANGTIKGGYYPVVFDREQSFRQNQLEEMSSVKEMFGGNWARAMTKNGHTKERVGTGGKPLSLNLSGLSNHLANVIHDLSFREAVIDAHKLLNDADVRQAIQGAAGKEMYKQLNPWLHAIAGDRRSDPMDPVSGLLAKARAGATVVNLGLKVTSALVQTLGYFNSVNELGVKYAARGLKDFFGKPLEMNKTWSFISERSAMMNGRLNNWDRDVRDANKTLAIGDGKGILSAADVYTNDLRKAFFAFTGYMDLATAAPTWLGAYKKVLDGAVEGLKAGDEIAAVDYADQVVRQTQSAGGAKDNAAIQRGHEAFKIFTMFYSQLSLQFGLFQKAGQKFRGDRNLPRLMASAAMLWFLPAIMEQVIRGRAPGLDDDDDEVLAWLARQEIFYPLATMIGVRDIARFVDRYTETGMKDFQGSPVFDAAVQLGQTLAIPFKAATGQDVDRDELKSTLMTAGYAFALPTKQTWMTLEFFYDWMTGEVNPDSLAEGFYQALVTGRKK